MKLLKRVAAAVLLCASASPALASTIVLGGYPDQIQFIDDTDGSEVDKITLASGLPTNIQLSQDGKQIFVTTNTTSGVEVIDAASRKVVRSISLNSPTMKYRFIGGVPDPTGRYFYVLGDRFEKELDLYRVGKPRFMVVDLKSGEVVRSQEMDAEDIAGMGYRARLAISPDGKTLYAFQKKVLVVDAGSLKVVDRIDLEKPDLPDMMGIGFGGNLGTLRDPNEFVALFNAEDPYVHNKVFGVARFNLSSRTFTFDPIGPAPDEMAGLEVTPDGKEGYTVVVNGDLGNQRCEFWHFDLATNMALDKAEFPCRRRFYFSMSRDTKKLYVYGAGYDIAVYDAETLKFEKEWELQNDITMAGILTLP